MYTLLVVTHVLVSVALIGLVLIQHGKGADAGAAFGSGASGTVFGSRGSANFLTRTTAWLAGAFFVISLLLAYVVNNRSGGVASVVDAVPAAPAAGSVEVVPAKPDITKTEPQVPTADLPKADAGVKPDAAKPKVPE